MAGESDLELCPIEGHVLGTDQEARRQQIVRGVGAAPQVLPVALVVAQGKWIEQPEHVLLTLRKAPVRLQAVCNAGDGIYAERARLGLQIAGDGLMLEAPGRVMVGQVQALVGAEQVRHQESEHRWGEPPARSAEAAPKDSNAH